ncbi:vacuolar alkaline phosphatase [Vermiconidia calcicola]|uniref:Vacuolar alkaline phosphatase n=1 Tax=Vermiconidia calcicola TaxID=1690605 RepID=A0ACC3MKU0_9PEZI|nr:vacuolar alkaline phosphatase [Vermiconidia calcicola]
MAEPLLAHRPGSQNSSEAEQRGVEEEDALLTGHSTGKQAQSTTQIIRSKWREIGLFVWALVATAAVVVLAVVYQHSRSEGAGGNGSRPSGKHNLIFMVSDGMGPTSLSLTRTWRQHVEGLPYDESLVLDEHLIGQSRTRSSSSLVTDSAAGATAFSCGMKSYNGAISVLPGTFEPCGSVMEAAHRRGYTTGLVVTTRITDATPAVFVAHARRREMEDDIARQMIGEKHPLGRMVDLMFGGGRCHFSPEGAENGCRSDNVNVVDMAKNEGWGYIDSKQDFDKLGTDIKLPFLGLFADHDIPYEIDRQYQDDTFPSLEAMATKALKALSAATKDKDQGFFVMIEGSRIDHAGHSNDPAAQVHEVLAYDRTMAAVLDFIKKEKTPTLMVSTSDHETGGLAVARQLHREYPPYLWHPSVLANVSHSAGYTAHEYHKHVSAVAEHGTALDESASEDMRAYLQELSSKALGISDCSEEEINALVDEPKIALYHFADMISRRAQTGWSTHGHSGADVNIYSSDPLAAKALTGNHENTEIGEFLRSYLELDDEVETVTKLLKKHMDKVGAEKFLGRIPEDDERLDGQDHMDEYHGDHKTRRCEVCGL